MDASTRGTAGRIPLPDLQRVRAAALRATRVYPGPVGQMVARELRAYAEFGHRFGTDGLIDRIASELLEEGEPPWTDDRPLVQLVGGRSR